MPAVTVLGGSTLSLSNVATTGACGSGANSCQVLAIDFYNTPAAWKHFATVSNPSTLQITGSVLSGGYYGLCCFGSACYVDSSTIQFLITPSGSVAPTAIWLIGSRTAISSSTITATCTVPTSCSNNNGVGAFYVTAGSYLTVTNTYVIPGPTALLLSMSGQSSAQFTNTNSLSVSTSLTILLGFGCTVDYDRSMSAYKCVFYPGSRFNTQMYTQNTASLSMACP